MASDGSPKVKGALGDTEGTKPLEMGAPLHPGAIRAYKEAGILK